SVQGGPTQTMHRLAHTEATQVDADLASELIASGVTTQPVETVIAVLAATRDGASVNTVGNQLQDGAADGRGCRQPSAGTARGRRLTCISDDPNGLRVRVLARISACSEVGGDQAQLHRDARPTG